jgi:dipeptidyl-peptidase-4
MDYSSRIANTYFARAVSPRWLPGAHAFWYRVEVGPGQHEFVFVDALRGERRAAFDHAKLAQVLGPVLGAELKQAVSGKSLPFSWIEPAPDGSSVRFRIGSQLWQFDRDATLARTEAKLNEEKLRPLDRPRPSWRTGEATAITFVNRIGGEKRPYGTIAPRASLYRTTFAGHIWQLFQGEDPLGAWEAGEDEAQTIVERAPDGKYLAARQVVPAQEHKVTLVESSPRDQLRGPGQHHAGRRRAHQGREGL